MRRSPSTLPLPAALLCALLGALLAVPAAAGGADPGGDTLPDRPLRAGFLVVDGVYNSELMAPYDILHHTVFHAQDHPGGGIEVFTVSPDGEPVTTFEGLRLVPHHGFDDAPPIDVLVVPSAEGSLDEDLEDERMIGWVRRVGRQARFVVSLCDGAFVLAQAGLLDGRAATTFPADYQAFADRFPAVDLKINVSFVQDGRLLTSQGGARSYDVAMYLVDLLYGPEVAAGVGRGLLIPWPPEPEAMPKHVTDSMPRPPAEPLDPGAADPEPPAS
ncbi:MAG: DJ-1/PfpI family protein [Acidobacteriota bacterium]|jgi:transcriptional regulator GlxA family with amidase domain